MTSRLSEISVDCADPAALARFWCAVLDYVVVAEEPGLVEIAPDELPDDARLAELRAGPATPSIVLARVPEGKAAKNRLHLDLSPVDRSHDEEVERLLGLGATRADVGQTGEESWTVLADPEGNELCVLRSIAPGHFSL